MSAWDALQTLLATDPRDAGCADTFQLIHAYAEIAAAGGDPEASMPGITIHLTTCGPCASDYLSLLAAVRAEGNAAAED